MPIDDKELRYFKGQSGNDYLTVRDGKGRFRTWRVDLIRVSALNAAIDCGADQSLDTKQAWAQLWGRSK